MLTLTRCPVCGIVLDPESGACPQCDKFFCPDCAEPLAEDADRCGRCGAEFASYCSECGLEVPASAAKCPHCQALLEEENLSDSADEQNGPVEWDMMVQSTANCPSCGAEMFLEDGFCSECGLSICPGCGQIVEDEDEICPHCHRALFTKCPLCDFELVAGSDQCPNCNALIPNFCIQCHAELSPGDLQCAQCAAPVRVLRRGTARVIHSLTIGEQIVQVAACPGCGGQLHVHEGRCSACGYRICPTCQIVLEPDELICPRCGPHEAHIIQTADQLRTCVSCGHTLQAAAEECDVCRQLYCPECLAAVGDDDLVCGACGAEFELECPDCGEVVGAGDLVCANCGAEF
jgi:predicted amidophosphoribosyltransferase